MKKTRQLHLWIGLICSVFILLQSVTGLLLNEKWILGGGEGGERPAFGQMQQGGQEPSGGFSDNAGASGGDNSQAATGGNENVGSGDTSAPQNGGAMPQAQGGPGGGMLRGPGGEGGAGGAESFIKNLHEGKIGGADISWLIDLAAIGMIILTVTGITLSVKTLRAQRKSRLKKQQAESAA